MSTDDASDKNEKVSFEDALEKAGFGAYSWNLVAVTGVTIIAYAMVAFSSTIILPTSACELQTTTGQQGVIAAAPVVGLTLGAAPWGLVADTRGRRKTLIISLLATSVVNVIASFSVNWIMLFIVLFCTTFVAGGQYSISMSLLSESVPMAKRNIVVLLVTSIFLLTQGIMAVIAIPVIPLSFSYYISGLGIYWNSWRTLLVIYTTPCILTAIWLYFMVESPKFALAKMSEEAALDILRTIHRRNNMKDEFQVKGLIKEVENKSENKIKDQIVPLFRMPLLKYTIIVTILFLFQQVSALQVWFPTIANQFLQMVEDGAPMNQTLCSVIRSSNDAPINPDGVPCSLNNTAMIIVLCTAALQSLVNGLVSLGVNSLGRRNTVIAVTATCGLSGILVNLVPNTIASASLFIVFLLGIMVLGLYTAIGVALFPTHLRALAVALTMSVARFGQVISVQVSNYLLVNNCDVGFYLFASVFASSAIAAAFLPDDRKLNKPSPQAPIKDVEENTSKLDLKL